jgi:anti-repressor protein
MHQNDTPNLEHFKDLLPVAMNQTIGEVINARDLHRSLGSKQHFSDWLKRRLEEAMAVEGQDFCVVDGIINLWRSEPESKNQRIEYALTLDTAKHIAMLEKNDSGRAIRQYFIETEKRRALPFNPSDSVSVLEFALSEARAAKEAKYQLELAAPKVEAFDALMDSSGLMYVSDAAKALKTGQVRLFAFLRDAGVLMSDRDHWNVPYQTHIDNGRFEIKLNTVKIVRDGVETEKTTQTTFVTAKGLEYIRKLLERERAA